MLSRLLTWLAARLRFSKRYGGATLVVLAIELVIALFVRDAFVRPYVGDTLAVVLLYCGALSVLELPRINVAMGALGVALLVELGQAFQLADRFGLVEGDAMRVVLGTYSDVHDVFAYVAALPVIALTERAATSSPRSRCSA